MGSLNQLSEQPQTGGWEWGGARPGQTVGSVMAQASLGHEGMQGWWRQRRSAVLDKDFAPVCPKSLPKGSSKWL